MTNISFKYSLLVISLFLHGYNIFIRCNPLQECNMKYFLGRIYIAFKRTNKKIALLDFDETHTSSFFMMGNHAHLHAKIHIKHGNLGAILKGNDCW